MESDEERKRTAALALWRYGHDYLKAAQALCEANRVLASESQAHYLLAAQGVEFALKAFLRARQIPPGELAVRLGHSLQAALAEATTHGLTTIPPAYGKAIEFIAQCHRDDEFRYFDARAGANPGIGSLLGAGTWILTEAAEGVVADHYLDHGGGNDSTPEEMLRRMRGDLEATRAGILRLQ